MTGQILGLMDTIPIEIDDIKKATLMSIQELEPYKFSYDPLTLGSFFKLCTLLLQKSNALPQ